MISLFYKLPCFFDSAFPDLILTLLMVSVLNYGHAEFMHVTSSPPHVLNKIIHSISRHSEMVLFQIILLLLGKRILKE